MASPNISFDSIPSSIRKPGKYFEFNTKLAVRTLPANEQKVLLIAPMLSTGLQAPLTTVDIFSDEEAAVYFGRGSIAHLMARSAIKSYSYVRLSMIGVLDSDAGVAATGTITLSGPSTSSGQVSLLINNTQIDIAVANGDSASALATKLQAAIAAVDDLPVTASVAGAAVTLTCRHKGAVGNEIAVTSTITATGVTATIVAMNAGAGDPDITPALAAVYGAGHNIIACPFSTSTALTAMRTHAEAVSGPLEKRGVITVAGWRGTLATGTTLSASQNDGRGSIAWHNGSAKTNAEIAAGYAAVIASEEDPARPLNTLVIKSLDVTPLAKRPSRNEQENALYNGLTPLEIGSGDTVQIVRAITTYTKNAAGTDDVSLLDLTTIRTLDYVRKACDTRISLRFPREKLSDKTAAKVRSELLDVLYKLEDLEIVEAVDDNKGLLIVERDSQDVNRLNAAIPTDVVNGLHVFAGRIDLYL